MPTEVIVAIVGSVTTMVVAIGGWVFAWFIQREAKELKQLSRQVERLQRTQSDLNSEILVRIDMEDIANEEIARLDKISADAAKSRVRRLTKEKVGRSPQFSRSDFKAYTTQALLAGPRSGDSSTQ